MNAMIYLSAREWNDRHPAGTLVSVYPGTGKDRAILGRTRSQAWDLDGMPVVLVEGKSGAIALTHVGVTSPGRVGLDVAKLYEESPMIRPVTVTCDVCRTTVADWYIGETTEARFDLARAYVVRLGWDITTAGDFCPEDLA